MDKITECKILLQEGKVSQAIKQLQDLKASENYPADELYYLLGNACRKQQDWQQAIRYYQEALDINPQSPARHALTMVHDILNFYHRDLYNP